MILIIQCLKYIIFKTNIISQRDVLRNDIDDHNESSDDDNDS